MPAVPPPVTPPAQTYSGKMRVDSNNKIRVDSNNKMRVEADA